MAIFDKFRKSSAEEGATAPVADEKGPQAVDPVATTEKIPVDTPDDSSPPSDNVSEDVQRGVQYVEAAAKAWSKPVLIWIFINIWLLYFVNAFQSAINYSLIPYVTSDFETHSLLSTIFIVANSITAACYIPLSKILDLWGRAEGFLLMTIFATMGLVMMAACKNLSTFCAAYVFYSLGFSGMTFCVDVLTADASKLKNRGLAYAFTSSPYIITAFAGPEAAEDFYEKISWRWGFGAFSIIFPVVAAPLYIVLKIQMRKAEKQGLVKHESSGRTLVESIWHYIIAFDALGVILFAGGLTVFLLPFTLASTAPNGWKTDYIIAMIIVGFVVICIFLVYEWFWAPKPMLNFRFFADRSVVGTCLLSATYQISYYCWAYYFSSFLQVVNDLSMSHAGYIDNTFNVVSGVLLFIVGFAIRKTGYYKWLLYIAVPLYILAQGLMIYFRRPDQHFGYLIMCEVFISIGGSIFIIVQQVSILAVVDHQHVAAALALIFVVGTTGGAIGAAISGSIWTNTFLKALKMYLPADVVADEETLMLIYEDLYAQLSYPAGDPIRHGIQKAYGYAQTRMLSAGTAFMVLAIVATLLMRNINVRKNAQVKGTVF